MTQAVVAIAVLLIAVAVLTAMSLWANRRFEAQSRLPMQWLLDGQVTWTAPRRVALAFTPVLAGLVLAGIAALTVFVEPRAGQEGLVAPVTVVVALAFIGVHALHIWLIQRSLQRQG